MATPRTDGQIYWNALPQLATSAEIVYASFARELERENARLRKAVDAAALVLRKLEWSARYSYCTGYPCCPICKGIEPGQGGDEYGNLPYNQGHRDTCILAAAIIAPNDKVRNPHPNKTL